jgi:hypothetical protein
LELLPRGDLEEVVTYEKLNRRSRAKGYSHNISTLLNPKCQPPPSPMDVEAKGLPTLWKLRHQRKTVVTQREACEAKNRHLPQSPQCRDTNASGTAAGLASKVGGSRLAKVAQGCIQLPEASRNQTMHRPAE